MLDVIERRMTHLQWLEAEAIHIIREVAAAFDNPCMFYSIGKDSTVMLHLARKAFYPGRVPFPLLHIDTTWEFAEMARFRDRLAAEHDLQVHVHINEAALAEGVHPIESGSVKYNDQMKTAALKMMNACVHIYRLRSWNLCKCVGFASAPWVVIHKPAQWKVVRQRLKVLLLKC
jgi:sulfate adenylyltransferase subunit 2